MDERLRKMAMEAGLALVDTHRTAIATFARLVAADCAKCLHEVGPTASDYDGDNYEQAEVADAVIGQCIHAIHKRYP